jgi:hypothetical protein
MRPRRSFPRRRARTAALAGASATLALGFPARADDDTSHWLSGGFLYSSVHGDSPANGYGAELSYTLTPPLPLVAVGGFAQAQAYAGDAPTHGRFAFGVLGGSFVGFELGIAHRAAAGDFDSTTGIHVAPYLSSGVLSLATRWTIAPWSSGHGSEFALSFALKYPWHIAGKQPSFGHGRPLRVAGKSRVAGVIANAAWIARGSPDPSGLSRSTRARLASAWLRDARAEHASVAAFSRLALNLIALGAPPRLIARAHRAALEEIEHARLCFALASAYGGCSLGPAALHDATRAIEPPTLARLACDSFAEGCWAEGAGVARARAALCLAKNGAVRAALRKIVTDEARHTRLAWDVVRFALENGGAGVEQALAATIAEHAADDYGRVASADPVAQALLAHGQPPAAWTRTAELRAMRSAVARARKLLARARRRRSISGRRR